MDDASADATEKLFCVCPLPSVSCTGARFGTGSRVMPSESSCRKCGRSRTRVVGQSAVPPGVFVRCDACGHSSLVAADAEPSSTTVDVDARRVERLVLMVFDDKRMPCEVQGVVKTAAGWRVTARLRQRDVVRFDLKAGGFASIRAEIERVLAAT
jgi:hypothetical protein